MINNLIPSESRMKTLVYNVTTAYLNTPQPDRCLILESPPPLILVYVITLGPDQ